MDSGLEIDQIYVGIRISIVEILCVPFSAKMDNFDFFGPNLPKNGLGLEIQKTNVGIRISILEISCVPNFRKNRQFDFFGPNLPKNGFWGRNSESAPPRYHMHQFSV